MFHRELTLYGCHVVIVIIGIAWLHVDYDDNLAQCVITPYWSPDIQVTGVSDHTVYYKGCSLICSPHA